MTNESKANDRYFTLKLLATVILAFVTALCFRRSAGILAMTPVMIILCAASVFIDISNTVKCVVFAFSVFMINTIEAKDIKVTIMFSALCLLAVAVFNIAFLLIKKKKKYGYVIAVLGLFLCVFLNLRFIGNPFTALDAKDRINEYTNATYPNNENAALGEFEFTNIYYRYDTKAYVTDAKSSHYPVDIASITVGDSLLQDGFKGLMEEKISEPYVLEITDVLREAFPNASFSVKADGFSAMPDRVILSSASGELNGNMHYEITLGGVQTSEAMLKTAYKFINAIDRSGVGYAKITFKSGIGNFQRRSITVDPNHLPYHAKTELLYVPLGTTNRFNEYIFETIIFD